MKKIIILLALCVLVAAFSTGGAILEETETKRITKIVYDDVFKEVIIHIEDMPRTQPTISLADFETESELRAIIAERIEDLLLLVDDINTPTISPKVAIARGLENKTIELKKTR